MDLYDNDNDNQSKQDEDETSNHWIISDDTFDIDDDEWNDESMWVPSDYHILTSLLRRVVEQRCSAHTYCLCQYVDHDFDGGRKHPCAKGDPDHPQRVVHVMDDFVKEPKAEFIPLKHYDKSPLKIEFHYKPHIEHLHVVGGIPFFHRRHHNRRYKIPWMKYARYEHLRPKKRPNWLPLWMWREIGAHTHSDPRKVNLYFDHLMCGLSVFSVL